MESFAFQSKRKLARCPLHRCPARETQTSEVEKEACDPGLEREEPLLPTRDGWPPLERESCCCLQILCLVRIRRQSPLLRIPRRASEEEALPFPREWTGQASFWVEEGVLFSLPRVDSTARRRFLLLSLACVPHGTPGRESSGAGFIAAFVTEAESPPAGVGSLSLSSGGELLLSASIWIPPRLGTKSPCFGAKNEQM